MKFSLSISVECCGLADIKLSDNLDLPSIELVPKLVSQKFQTQNDYFSYFLLVKFCSYISMNVL